MRVLSTLLLLALMLPFLVHGAEATSDEPPRPAGTIDLDGIVARLGAIIADPEGKQLYVVGTSGSSVAAIDATSGKEIARIESGLGSPEGAAYLSGLRRLIVTSPTTGRTTICDDDLTKARAIRIETANGVVYDPKTKLAYVGYRGENDGIAVIDPRKAEKVGDIRLDGYPEGFQLEANGDRIFANIPRMQQIAVIDRRQCKVVTIWPWQDPRWSFPQNFPMALDEEHHRLFVGCRRPAKLIVIDTNTGKIVSTVDCCPKVGNVYYDAQRKRIYASGDEYASVFKQADPDT